MQTYAEDWSSREVLADLLRRYVGHGNMISVEALAQDCGCSIEAVYQARKGQTVGLDLAMRMLRCLPDEAVTEFFSYMGFTGVHRIDGAAGDHQEAGIELASASMVYASAMRDCRIDHREDRILKRSYFKVISCLSRITARRAGA